MKKKIIISLVVLLIVILTGVGLWAYKTGKLAGLADTGPAQIDIFTKDTSGNAVGFVDILVSSDGQNYFPASPPLRTQSNGHVIYSDPVFQNHTLYLKASKPYHSTSPDYRQLSVSSGNRYNTDFTVTPITQDLTKGKLKGKVTEAGTNDPINGAYIAVAKGTQVSNTGYSNVQGDYGVANIVPDTYTIISYRNGYQRKETPNITITASQETTLDITLSKESSPTPTPSQSLSPSPSAQPDRNNFLFTAEVVDQDTQQLVKDVKVSIKINPAINGAVEATGATKDSPIDASKYQNNNLLIKVPYPFDCYSMRTKYTVELSHPAYETQTLPDFYCSDIAFSNNLQTYFYNAHGINLHKKITFEYTGQLQDECASILSGFTLKQRIIEGATIVVINSHDNIRYSAISDKNGEFEIKEIPLDISATYKVNIVRDGYEDVNLEFSGNQVIILGDVGRYWLSQEPYYLNPSGKGSILEGIVKDQDTGRPLPYAVVSLIQDNKITTSFVGANNVGRYCLNSEPGNFTAFAYHPAYYDNERAVKDITLEKGKNQLDFELKFIPDWKRYDLYLHLLDPKGSPIVFPDDYIPEKLILGIGDSLRPELSFSHSELIEKDGKMYIKFNNMYCGRRFSLGSAGRKIYDSISYQVVYPTFVKFDCPNNEQEHFLDLRLVEITEEENDPNKPDVYGKVNFKGYCTFYNAGVYSDPNVEKIRVVMKQNLNTPDEKTVYSTVVSNGGFYQFLDVNPGSYSLGAGWIVSNIVSNFENIDVVTKDIERDLWAIPNQSQTTNLTMHGINLYFVGPVAQKYAEEIDWTNLTAKYAPIQNLLNDNYKPTPLILPVYIIDSNPSTAYYFPGIEGNKNCEASIRVNSGYLSESLNMLDVLIHEYGHHVRTSMQGNDLQSWQELFDAAKKKLPDQNCVFQAIRESNLGGYFDKAGHPEDHENEFFASFFVAYFQHHERLLALIRSLPEGSECRNILEFAWQFFSEKVAKTPGESINTASSTNSIRLYSNDDEIFGPVVGGNIGNNIYTPEQIAKGFWKQSVYDRLKPAQKAQLKASLAYRRVLNYLKIDPEKYRNQISINVVKFNSFVDKMLGTRGDRGSIEGVVKEQNGGPKVPKENAIVIIGRKMAVTDKDGKFKIENIKTGEQKVRVIDGKTSKAMNSNIESINIQKDKIIKRFFEVN